MILKDTPWKESYDPSRQHIKKPRHYFVNKVPPSQAMVFPVVMNGCDSWTVKKAENRRTDAFELWCWRRLLRVPWTLCKEMHPVHSKVDQSWVFFGRTDDKAETPILWPPDEELTHLKRPWCWERSSTGGEGDNRGWVAGQHHWLDGSESEWTPGAGDGQWGLVGKVSQVSRGPPSEHFPRNQNLSVSCLLYYTLLT